MNRVASHTIAATSGAVLTAAVALITPLEGIITHPYRDSVGVLTYCIGETEGAKLGMTYTVKECKDILKKSLVKYDNALMKSIGHDIPDSVHVAFLSVIYNIGIRGFTNSSMARDAKAGNYIKACNDLKNWWKAGKYPTLLKGRREAERKKCLEDL